MVGNLLIVYEEQSKRKKEKKNQTKSQQGGKEKFHHGVEIRVCGKKEDRGKSGQVRARAGYLMTR